MLEDQEDFEGALERAAHFLAHPPAPGTVEERSFMALLGDIDRYRPAVAAEPVHDSLIAQLADLDRGLAEFRKRFPDHHLPGSHPTAIGPNFGFGKDLRGET